MFNLYDKSNGNNHTLIEWYRQPQWLSVIWIFISTNSNKKIDEDKSKSISNKIKNSSMLSHLCGIKFILSMSDINKIGGNIFTILHKKCIC